MKNLALQRDSLIEYLYLKNEEKVKFISPDFGAKPLDEFRIKRPKSFIYTGIAEQVSVDIAYGIALGNFLPILYGMSPFISARCYEQYKVLFGQTNLPVCLLPVGVGLGYDHNTLSHYSLDDIGLYSSIPGMEIYTPYDSVTAIEYLQNWLSNPSKIVLRLERQPMPTNIFNQIEEFESNELGIITKRNANDLIISWGYLGVKLLEESKQKDVDIFIIDKMKSKISNKMLDILRKYKNITITEESYTNTGMAALLNKFLSHLKSNLIFRHVDHSIADLRAHRFTVWEKYNLNKI